MTPNRFLAAALAAALTLASAGLARAEIAVTDPYVRAAGSLARSGAAFMVIRNTGPTDDRLIAAASDAAERVELHTHRSDANGVMQMVEVPEGFVIPAGGSHALARGGDHVMFLGLTRPLADGDTVTVTLTFEQAGDVVVQIPVDNARKPAMMRAGQGGHGAHGGQGMAPSN